MTGICAILFREDLCRSETSHNFAEGEDTMLIDASLVPHS